MESYLTLISKTKKNKTIFLFQQFAFFLEVVELDSPTLQRGCAVCAALAYPEGG